MFRINKHRLNGGGADCDFVRSPNVGGPFEPAVLVIHYTASGPGFDTPRYFSAAGAKVSAHLVIRRDGSIVQCVPFNEVAWHAGKSQWTTMDGLFRVGLNKHSIGIELENWGPLQKGANGYVSWTGVPVSSSTVVEAVHKHGGPSIGWESYPAVQLAAAADAARAICEEYGIAEIVGHEDISPGRKTDPGPAFRMDSFVSQVLGRSDDGDASLVVRSPTGLNLRSGPGVEHGLLRSDALPDGTRVLVQKREGDWRFVSVLDAAGKPDYSGWVNGSWLSAF